MSNLSIALKRLLARHQISPAELARASHVNEPKLSRWLNDTQTFISDEDLESIAVHISNDPRERAELIVARLQDNLTGPGAEYVEIKIAGSALREEAPAYANRMPAELLEAIPLFIENWRDTDVRNMIISLKNLLSRGTCAVSSAEMPGNDRTGSSDTERIDKGVAAAVERGEKPAKKTKPR